MKKFACLPLLFAFGCGQNPATSQEKVDFSVNTSKVTADDTQDIKDLLKVLTPLAEDGERKVSLKEVLGNLEIGEQFGSLVKQILSARSNDADVQCHDRLCKVVSQGEAFSFKPEGDGIPILGMPTIYLDPTITAELQLTADGQRLEVCKIDGLQAKLGSITTPIDGLLMQLDQETVKSLVIDVGIGGSYPNANCAL